MPIEGFALTHTGTVRANNEDTLCIEPDLALAVVADGMGGENSGEVASAITMETVVSYMRNPPEDGLSPPGLLKEAVRAANRSVWEAAHAREDCKGMGSTIVVAHWRDDRMWIVNVGDSRAYLWRSGELRQLTYDQNLGNDLRTSLGLTDEQVRQYPHHNVLTMAVGATPDVLIREHEETVMTGDVILLCSDGLYGPIGDSGIAGALAQWPSLPGVAAALIEAANRAGGPDNISVAVLRKYEG